MIVLDTNDLSEVLRQEPDQNVTAWMRSQPFLDLYTTAVCEAEIVYGVALLPAGKRRTSLETATRAIFETRFVDRILSFDSAAARAFGEIAAVRRRAGRPIGEFDAQIAAIARANGATLATRDVKGFEGCGVTVVSPCAA